MLGFTVVCVSRSLLSLKWFPASVSFLIVSISVLGVVSTNFMLDGFILNSLILGALVVNAKAHNRVSAGFSPALPTPPK